MKYGKHQFILNFCLKAQELFSSNKVRTVVKICLLSEFYVRKFKIFKIFLDHKTFKNNNKNQ